jgi:hypothetical protein
MRSMRVAQSIAAGLVATVALLLPGLAPAQEHRGTITGTVLDTGGGVMPGVSVTVTNVATGTGPSVVTNEVGFFQAPFLIPGMYQVTVELSGFKTLVRQGVELRVADRLALELVLEPGGAEETVTVTASAPVLQTRDASLGQVVDSRRVAELPIAHGQPYQLIGLAPGTTFAMSPRLDRPFEPTHIVGYGMSGARSNRSDITIDGIPSTATANAGEVIASYVPPQDLVQEFKVQTATFDASFGNTEGGVTNLSIKSGTNQFRGSGYFVRLPRDLFANDFFANLNRIPLPDFNYNRWGGTLGGPIVRNRTFFQYGYEGIHEARPRNNGVPTVPTEAMRNGDFSALLALGPQYQLYNPFTRRVLPNGRIESDPFPGNIIPPELINPVARNILGYFGTPRTPGNPDGTGNYQRPELMERTEYGTHTVKVDHGLTDRQRLSGRVSWYDRNSNYNNYFDSLATGEWFRFVSRQAAVDHVYTINGTTVLNIRYGYDRFLRGINSNPGNHGFDLTELGFPAAFSSLTPPEIRRFPRINFPGGTYQGTAVGGEDRPIENNTLIASLTKVAGAHSVRTGLEYRRYRETNTFFGNNMTGEFFFDSTWTRGPLDNSPAAPGQLGQSVAAFLLGLPTSGVMVRPASYDERSSTWGFFVQDDWRIGSRLTLNLGVRYEFETPMYEVENRSVRGFDLAAVQPIEAAVREAYARNPMPEIPVAQFNLRGGLTFPGVEGRPRGLYETPKNSIMPRVGAAYQLSDRTVLRGGYGMFYGFLGQRRGDVFQHGFSANTPLVPSLDNGLTFIETLSNPFQSGTQEPLGAAGGIQTFLGQSISFFNENPRSPRMQRFQVSVQRELTREWVVEAAYVGNLGSQLETTRNLNALPQQYLSTSPVRDQATINYLSAQVPNPFFGLMPTSAIPALRGATIARERLLRPFPHFDNVTTTTNEGSSRYHALQLRTDRRFAGGYTLGVSYTYSRFYETTEFLNADDPAPTRHVSNQDTPHKLSLSTIVELPFGPGRRFLTETSPVVSKFVEGWQVAGIYAYQPAFRSGTGPVT